MNVLLLLLLLLLQAAGIDFTAATRTIPCSMETSRARQASQIHGQHHTGSSIGW